VAGSRRWALVVGASAYEFFTKLEYSAFDAGEFADSLITHLNFDPKRVVLLTDSEGSGAPYKPTRNYIFHHLGVFSNPDSAFYLEHKFDPIGEDDLFLFYFSGHGLRTEDGQQYLLPIEASDQNVTQTGVPLEDVVKVIDKLPCSHKVLFIDACRSDLDGVTGAKGPSFDEGFGRPDVVDREGMATFYSCDPQQRSYEVEDLRHGTFTYELLQAVTHTDVNTLADLDKYLTSRVPQLNVRSGKPPQKPFCVLNPSDMRDLPLFRLFQETGISDADELTAMANELWSQKKIDFDWWDKLTVIWEEKQEEKREEKPVYNLELKKTILRRFHAAEMNFPEFQARWLRSEKHIPSVRAVQPEVRIAPNSAPAPESLAQGGPSRVEASDD
jgi:hypothetical protein